MVARSMARAGSKTSGSSWRVDVPTSSAAKRSAAKRMPTALLRPRRATAIPVNAIRFVAKSPVETARLEAEEVDRAREAGERARDREREEVVLRHRDAAVAGRLRVEADRPHLEAERRPVQEDVVDDEREERDEDARVERRQAPPDRPELRGLEHGVGARDRRLGPLKRPADLDEVRAAEDRDPVQHDRRDHLVGADGRLQDPGDSAPDRRRRRSDAEREEDVERPRRPLEVRPDVEGREEADPVLALPADVEEAAAEGERDRDSGQDERRHQDERLLEVVRGVLARLARHPREEPVQAGALEDRLVGRDRVRAGDQDDEAADQEGEHRRGDRDEDTADPRREPLGDRRGRACLRARARARSSRHAASFRPPVMAMPSSSSETPGGYSPTIRPS